MAEPLADDSPKPKWTWRRFLERYKKRELDSNDTDGLFKRVGMPILGGSILCAILIDAECEAGDWAATFLLQWFAPAVVALILMISNRVANWRRHLGYKIFFTVVSVFLGSFFTWGLLGYVILANALTGEAERVYVAGPVIEKKGGSGARFTGHNYYLTIRYEGRPVCLTVSKADYDSHPVGWTYGREMQRGGYGYFYEWYFGSSWR